VHVGEIVVAKNMALLLAKVLDMEKVIYHSIAWARDQESIYNILKPHVSQVRDKNTRNKTVVG
jgi:hypothetical protein